jgi:DNA-binding response OmpR family regulator
MRVYIRSILQSEEIDSVEAETAPVATRLWIAGLYDLLILEADLLDTIGSPFLAPLEGPGALDPSPRVVVICASAEQASRISGAARAAVIRCIVQPFRPEGLIEAVQGRD